MITASWICLWSPLAAALAITLLGQRLTRRGAGFLASGSVLVSFIGALVAFIGLLARKRRRALAPLHRLGVADRRELPRRPLHPARPALCLHDADRLRGRLPDRRLLHRVHGRRRRGAPLLRVHGAVRVLDAAARPVGEPADPARRLGPGRSLLLPADRLLARAAERGRRGQEGVHHERVRRRDLRDRPLPAHPAHRARSTTRSRSGAPTASARPSRT